MSQQPPEKPVTAPDQLTLAMERTYLAYERTLMAWTRTSTSLIAFGFTLFKFFEYLHERGEAPKQPQLFGARNFGMLMIGIGVFTLLVASVQHHVRLRHLKSNYPDAPFSLALMLSGLIAFLGILGFISGIIHSPATSP